MAGGVNKVLPLPQQSPIPRRLLLTAPAAHLVRDSTANGFVQISQEAAQIQIHLLQEQKQKLAWNGQQLERKKLIKLIELDKRPPTAVQPKR